MALEWFVSWILDELMKDQCLQYKIWGNILYYYKFLPIKREKFGIWPCLSIWFNVIDEQTRKGKWLKKKCILPSLEMFITKFFLMIWVVKHAYNIQRFFPWFDVSFLEWPTSLFLPQAKTIHTKYITWKDNFKDWVI